MGLSCATGIECDDPSSYAWMWSMPKDIKKLDTKRSRKCCSCKIRIAVGEDCLEYPRARVAKNETEERINQYNWHDAIGECAVHLASWYQCDKCGNQALALLELGFTFDLEGSMSDLIEEYKVEYQGNPNPCI